MYTAPRSLVQKYVCVQTLSSVTSLCHDEWVCFSLVCFCDGILTTDPTSVPLQVTWIYEPKDGERINIAVFHPNFDPNYPDSPMRGRVSFSPNPPVLASPSIQIADVRMTDEGKYICEYATYPSGNEQGITYLVMLGRSTGLSCSYRGIRFQLRLTNHVLLQPFCCLIINIFLMNKWERSVW